MQYFQTLSRYVHVIILHSVYFSLAQGLETYHFFLVFSCKEYCISKCRVLPRKELLSVCPT